MGKINKKLRIKTTHQKSQEQELNLKIKTNSFTYILETKIQGAFILQV